MTTSPVLGVAAKMRVPIGLLVRKIPMARATMSLLTKLAMLLLGDRLTKYLQIPTIMLHLGVLMMPNLNFSIQAKIWDSYNF